MSAKEKLVTKRAREVDIRAIRAKKSRGRCINVAYARESRE